MKTLEYRFLKNKFMNEEKIMCNWRYSIFLFSQFVLVKPLGNAGDVMSSLPLVSQRTC